MAASRSAPATNGKIYRVRSAKAPPEASLLFDTSETHIISLAVDKQGNLYAGTDSNGIVMRFGADGKPFGLLDSPLREIHDIAIGPDGSIYVLALGESASTPKRPNRSTDAGSSRKQNCLGRKTHGYEPRSGRQEPLRSDRCEVRGLPHLS